MSNARRRNRFLTDWEHKSYYSVRFFDFPPGDFLIGDDVGRGVGEFVGPVGALVGTGVGPVGAGVVGIALPDFPTAAAAGGGVGVCALPDLPEAVAGGGIVVVGFVVFPAFPLALRVGEGVGPVGAFVGTFVGPVGAKVGRFVGLAVGDSVGCAVGLVARGVGRGVGEGVVTAALPDFAFLFVVVVAIRCSNLSARRSFRSFRSSNFSACSSSRSFRLPSFSARRSSRDSSRLRDRRSDMNVSVEMVPMPTPSLSRSYAIELLTMDASDNARIADSWILIVNMRLFDAWLISDVVQYRLSMVDIVFSNRFVNNIMLSCDCKINRHRR
jgi:hypothetical protein